MVYGRGNGSLCTRSTLVPHERVDEIIITAQRFCNDPASADRTAASGSSTEGERDDPPESGTVAFLTTRKREKALNLARSSHSLSAYLLLTFSSLTPSSLLDFSYWGFCFCCEVGRSSFVSCLERKMVLSLRVHAALVWPPFSFCFLPSAPPPPPRSIFLS